MKQWLIEKIFPEYWETIQRQKIAIRRLKNTNDELINEINDKKNIIMKLKQELKNTTFKWS